MCADWPELFHPLHVILRDAQTAAGFTLDLLDLFLSPTLPIPLLVRALLVPDLPFHLPKLIL